MNEIQKFSFYFTERIITDCFCILFFGVRLFCTGN